MHVCRLPKRKFRLCDRATVLLPWPSRTAVPLRRRLLHPISVRAHGRSTLQMAGPLHSPQHQQLPLSCPTTPAVTLSYRATLGPWRHERTESFRSMSASCIGHHFQCHRDPRSDSLRPHLAAPCSGLNPRAHRSPEPARRRSGPPSCPCASTRRGHHPLVRKLPTRRRCFALAAAGLAGRLHAPRSVVPLADRDPSGVRHSAAQHKGSADGKRGRSRGRRGRTQRLALLH